MTLSISEKYENLLERPVGGIVHFNDVLAERPVDPDAELTVTARNLGTFSDLMIPIGQNPRLAEYGTNLLNELLGEQRRIIDHIRERTGKVLQQPFSDNAVIAIANKADRNEYTTEGGKNGEDFHLAITDNGLEVYVVPLTTLQALETRNKILALFRIPNEQLTVTDGTREQFRSSIIATTRHFPEILEPVFEYQTREELLDAKQRGEHPSVIPEQERLAEFAFADKFGNVRLSVRDNKEFKKCLDQKALGERVTVKIGQGALEAFYVTSLKEIPIGQLGLYQNVADEETNGAGYWELVKRSEDCNNDPVSAFDILKTVNPNFKNEAISVH